MVYVAGWLRKQNYIFNISLLSIVYCSLSSIPRLPNLWKELKKTPTSPSDTPFPFRRKSLHFYFPSGLQICEERGLLSSCSKIIINTKIYSLPAHLLPVEKERGVGKTLKLQSKTHPPSLSSTLTSSANGPFTELPSPSSTPLSSSSTSPFWPALVTESRFKSPSHIVLIKRNI